MTTTPDQASPEPADLTQLFFGSRGQTIPQHQPGPPTDEQQRQAREFFGFTNDQTTTEETIHKTTHE